MRSKFLCAITFGFVAIAIYGWVSIELGFIP